MEYYNDGKRQVDLDFVLTKKQAMQHFFSCVQCFSLVHCFIRSF